MDDMFANTASSASSRRLFHNKEVVNEKTIVISGKLGVIARLASFKQERD